MCIRPVLALCTPLLVCLSAVAQEVSLLEPQDSIEVEQPAETSAEIGAAAAVQPSAGDSAEIGNADILEMTNAQFAETTIVAAIEANTTQFDVSPKALLALKSGGVPERVIEAMLAAEAAKKRAAQAAVAVQAEPGQLPAAQTTAAAQTAAVVQAAAAAAAQQAVQGGAVDAAAGEPAQVPAQITPEAMARLSEVIERLAVQTAATEPEPADAKPDPSTVSGQVPRAWVTDGEAKDALAPTIAQVALTDTKRSGSAALKTLQGFAGKALAFANPAFGLASGLGGLFRSDDPEATAVWALLGSSASRELSASTAFEIEFGNIPGVNPDQYRPAIVQLVPTSDNYRLVGAAKTTASEAGGMPSGPIIEEPVPAQLTQLARGRYRVSMNASIPPGEYALVLRPIAPRERERKRNSEESLGDLMGGGSSQILYMTWDFTIRS